MSQARKGVLGRTSANLVHGSFCTSTASACRLLDSLHRRNHRPDSSRGSVRGLRFFFRCGNGNLKSILQSSRGNASQRDAHSVRTNFSFRLPLLLRGRKLAVLRAIGEFRLARNSRKALLRHLCGRQHRQTNRFLASQLAFLRRTAPGIGARCGRILFRDRLPLCWLDAQ